VTLKGQGNDPNIIKSRYFETGQWATLGNVMDGIEWSRGQ